jgi:hypothetical protein
LLSTASRENLPQPIIVNFPGFAELFAHVKAPAIAPPALPALPAPHATAVLNVAPDRHASLPPMDLFVFCRKYQLSVKIKTKLEVTQITGPHVLHVISDADLQGKGALSVGELASV